MKSLAIAEKYGWSKYVGHQIYYALANREYEWELMPLGIKEKVGAIIWSPMAGGKLGGKYRRNQPLPQNSRAAAGGSPVPDAVTNEEVFYNIVDMLYELAEETGKSVVQILIETHRQLLFVAASAPRRSV